MGLWASKHEITIVVADHWYLIRGDLGHPSKYNTLNKWLEKRLERFGRMENEYFVRIENECFIRNRLEIFVSVVD